MKKFGMWLPMLLAIAAFAQDKSIDQIKILMTQQETADYAKLKSDDDRKKFVTDFWVKRDPTPGTPKNEYKDLYEKNVAEVITRMKNDRAYESDMGQTLLLLGVPSEQKQEEGGSAAYDEKEESESTGKQVWIYKKLPADLHAGELKIEFIPGQGTWRFADKKQMQPILEKARLRPVQVAQAAAQKAQVAQPQAPVKAKVGQMPPVSSPDVKVALDAIASGSAPADVPVRMLADSFMTSTGETFVTFAVHSPAAVAGAKVGIRVLDSSGKVVAETEVPFVDSTAKPPEPAGYFQNNLQISPGEHSVLLAVVSGGKAGGEKRNVSVPDYSGKFGMSSIIVAKSHQQLTDAKPEKTPYTFGKIKVDPNPARIFTKKDSLMIVYEAYNFQGDASGKPNLEVTIGFQKQNEGLKQLPPGPAEGLVTGKKITVPTGFQLSEKIFTPGEWKIFITIKDKISNQTAKQEAAFTIQ